jgi:heme/copper-type cytochrome/quinol oxidase subunit 2
MLANTVTFAVGFGAFLVAFVILAIFVVRFAGRVGRRRSDPQIGASSSPRREPDGPADGEQLG